MRPVAPINNVSALTMVAATTIITSRSPQKNKVVTIIQDVETSGISERDGSKFVRRLRLFFYTRKETVKINVYQKRPIQIRSD